jgi:hypothetical protein
MDTPALHGQKALVFDFDSIRQRALWERETSLVIDEHQLPPFAVTQLFSGLLRTADILTSNIVIPDVQLLDGAMFMHHGPDVVRSLLARSSHESLGIDVVGRDGQLAQCLRIMVLGRDESASTLARFEFSSLAAFGVDPRAIAEAVSKRPSRRLKECGMLDVPRVVAAEFQAAAEGSEMVEEPTGVFAAMANRWRAWIVATEKDPQGVRAWDNALFDMEWAFGLRPMPDAIATHVPTDEAFSLAVAGIRSIRGRSTMLAELDAQAPGVLADRSHLLDAWWSSAYFDALARQHSCSWLRLDNTEAEALDVEASRASGTTTLQFEGSLIGTLSEMPAGTYASAKYSAREAISRWSRAPIARNSDALAFAIMKFIEPVDRQETKRALWKQVWLTLVPAFLGAAATYFFSAVAGIWTVVVGAVGVLLTTPISELLELYSLRSKKMKSFINIPGGAHD